MSKIFATSDIHANKEVLNLLVKFLRERSDIDRLLVCGDLAGKYRVSSIEELSKLQERDINYLVERLKVDIPQSFVYILGNDDWVDFDLSETRFCNYLPHYYEWNYEEVGYVPFEWTTISPFSTNREANDNKLAYELGKLKNKNYLKTVTGKYQAKILEDSIVVAHCPPYDSRDRCFNGDRAGSKSIRDFIEEVQPKAWLCGHIHEDFGVDKIGETFVFNCACDHISNTLRGWVIDTETLDFEKIVI